MLIPGALLRVRHRKCFAPVSQMQKPKCWNCGEDCLATGGEQESQTNVPIHYFAEKKQVCPDCYQILRELDSLAEI
jgi:hypothetical protein